jgi:hypothetical protein
VASAGGGGRVSDDCCQLFWQLGLRLPIGLGPPERVVCTGAPHPTMLEVWEWYSELNARDQPLGRADAAGARYPANRCGSWSGRAARCKHPKLIACAYLVGKDPLSEAKVHQ